MDSVGDRCRRDRHDRRCLFILLSLVSLAHLFLKEHSRYGGCRALRKEAESNSTCMGLNMARTHIGGSLIKSRSAKLRGHDASSGQI